MDKFLEILKKMELDRSQAIHESEEKKSAIWEKYPRLKEIDRAITEASNVLFHDLISGKSDAQKKYDSMTQQLEMEKDCILIENEISPKDLQPKFKCADCEDKGYINGKMCHCLREMKIEATFSDFDLTPYAKEDNFNNFDLTLFSDEFQDHSKKILAFGKNYCLNFANEGHYIFIGKAGRGKTFLSNCIANELIFKGVQVIYITSTHLVNKAREYASEIESTSSSAFYYNALYDCDLLIIDDFGAEYQTDFSNRILFDIINSRILKKNKTIISTNLSIQEISSAYDVRLSSRIEGYFRQIRFPWDDIRIKSRNRRIR